MKVFLIILLPLIIIGGIFLYSVLKIIPQEMEDEIEILDFDEDNEEDIDE